MEITRNRAVAAELVQNCTQVTCFIKISTLPSKKEETSIGRSSSLKFKKKNK